MIYFTIHQDKRILNSPKLIITKQEIEELRQFPTPDSVFVSKIIYVKNELLKKIDYPDLIEMPILLISEKLKSLMTKYQKNIWMRTIVLIEKETNQQRIYYAVYPPRLACASIKSTYDFNNQFKKFILDEKKVGYNRIFIAEGMEKSLIVRLDVAESILRRKSNGIIFEEVENEKGDDDE